MNKIEYRSRAHSPLGVHVFHILEAEHCCDFVVFQSVMQGTIPYLGTFLTDLVMMDTAMKDYVDVSDSLPLVQPNFFIQRKVTEVGNYVPNLGKERELPPC